MSKKKLAFVVVSLVLVALAAPTLWFSAAGQRLRKQVMSRIEPDLPAKGGVEADEMEPVDKIDYLTRRQEQLDLLQGFDTATQDSRANAIAAMQQAEAIQARNASPDAPMVTWQPLGPAPIPISASTAYSGRTSAIAVHPTNPNIVYAGTAQGGLYRSLDGGATWVPLMDNAATLAIGAVAISPSNPSTIYVGTGESTQCGSGCFIGVGVYRIDNADTAPVLSGPLNKDAANNDVFTGRAISEILVHPADPNTIFVATTSGIAGIGANTTGLALPVRGIYRSTNAGSASPTFNLLSMGISERNVTDLYMDPVDPNRIYAGVIGVAAGDGGVYTSANALAPAPTFSQILSITLTGAQGRVELAGTNVGGTTTVYAATGEGTGTTYKSINAAPFTLVLDNNFCNAQCFYDIAVAVDPTNANNVYLGGSPVLPFGRSTNGGASYTNSSGGLHVDTQAITVAPSNPSIIYFGSDGGIWKSVNAGVNWTTLNNTTYSATQFMSIATHPTNTNYSLGGTQDNGTELLAPDGTWINSDGGDGGFAVIDQTSTSLADIVAYHTYFNQTGTQIGFEKHTALDPTTGDPTWTTFYGCKSGGAFVANGISCADPTLFYAPMVNGPVAADSVGKDTLYFGTNKLYRSSNLGVTMTPVSQALPATISAIGISPQNDNVRLAGTTSGGVYYSNTPGATTMTSVSAGLPSRYVGRIAISPVDENTAYVAFNGYGIPNQHVMKTVNLNAATPTWVNAGVGIPDVPTNALVIDPLNANVLYAGTDIGVFWSNNGGASWSPFGTGLPRVAVFGMSIQNTSRLLRIATHGKGMWQTAIVAPSAAGVSVSGRVLSSEGRGLKNARVTMSAPDGSVRSVATGPRGNYHFEDVPSGTTYIVSVASRRYTYEPRTLSLEDSVTGFDFTPDSGGRSGRAARVTVRGR